LKPLIIPIFVSHRGCPSRCLFCGRSAVGASLPEDLAPASVTARIDRFLATADASRTPFGTREIAFYGGTFTGLPASEQEALLELASGYVRAGRVRALRVSTHPLLVDEARLALLKRYRREHDQEVIVTASRLVREAGFVLGHQLMVGLPGASAASDEGSARFCASLGPALARIYPTLVLRGTGLEAEFRAGRYQPLTLEEALERTAAMLAAFHEAAVEVIRVGVHPDVDLEEGVLAGPVHPSFGFLALSRSYLRRVERALERTPRGRVRVVVSQRDRGAFLGPEHANERHWSLRFPAVELAVSYRPDLRRGELLVEPIPVP
jgi:histone acetyltransferase (RNA polymerase elongator complex component)